MAEPRSLPLDVFHATLRRIGVRIWEEMLALHQPMLRGARSRSAPSRASDTLRRPLLSRHG